MPVINKALAERTAERCAAEPLYARTHEALFRIERDLHRRGWDAPPAIWRLDNCEHRSLRYDRSEAFTRMLHQVCDMNDRYVGYALGTVADVVEVAAGKREPLVPLPDSLREAGLILAKATGKQLYGYALSSEGWGTNYSDSDSEEDWERRKTAAKTRRIHELPERVEYRMITAMCADGAQWWYSRVRGEQPQAWLRLPGDDDTTMPGLVANALSRIVVALVPDGGATVVPSDTVFKGERL